jgi:hypothetical protein
VHDMEMMIPIVLVDGIVGRKRYAEMGICIEHWSMVSAQQHNNWPNDMTHGEIQQPHP